MLERIAERLIERELLEGDELDRLLDEARRGDSERSSEQNGDRTSSAAE